MPILSIRFVVVFFLLTIFLSCASTKRPANSTAAGAFSAAREFRAAWVATVANINWPSKPGLSTEQQQQEAIALLDFLKDHNFNAVIFQVRPQADALYKSSLEPWSYYLTGVQGKAPDPYYDPLEFWTAEAHKRGLELHVWLNPYRAHHVSGGAISDSSMVKKMPNAVVKLKEGYWWFDPSKKETQDHGVAVVMDIVKRYDIDGVHFDDYFYPYPSYNGNEDFPDSASYAQYQAGGGKLTRGDWRRESVNTFIHRLYKNIKAEKKHVKFGLSPFGIWRPGYPASVMGFDQYDQLYADAKLWLNKGWIDYFSPQLYWPINRIAQSFPVLLGWWASENKMNRHLWPGISVSSDTSAKSTTETLNQIMISRAMLPKSSGVVHWSISSVTKNPNMAKALIEGPYQNQALVPASKWLDKKAPAAPAVNVSQAGDTVHVSWTHHDEKDVFRWVVYYQHGKSWNYRILNQRDRQVALEPLKGKNKLTAVAVTAVDRMGNESVRNETHADVVAIVPRSEWKANVPRPYKQHVPVRITVHHEGGKVLDASGDGAQRLKNIQTWCMGKDRNWADVPYHYLIAPDGTIYEGRAVNTVGETNTEYDPTGHLLICFLGNYEQQELNPELLNVLTRLIAYCCRKYDISPETISTHRDHSKQTTCPGQHIYPYFQNGYVKTKVKELLESGQCFKQVSYTPKWHERQRRQILKNMEKAMGKLPDRSTLPPLDIRITDSLKTNAYTRYSINFAVAENERLPAYLYIPFQQGTPKKLAAMLVLHGTDPLGKGVVDGQGKKPNRAHAKELAERGYVVIAPDYPSFADLSNYDFSKDRYQSGTMKGVFDHMRCVDLLQARPDVDPERIGVVGLSLGGHNSMFVGAFDTRIKVVVSASGWTLFDFYDAGKEVSLRHGGRLGPWAQDRYMPLLRDKYKLQKVPFDFDDVITAIAPRAFFSVSPLHDANFDVNGVKAGIASVAKVYSNLGAADNLQVRYPDAQHDFPVESRIEAYRFIDKVLNHTPAISKQLLEK